MPRPRSGSRAATPRWWTSTCTTSGRTPRGGTSRGRPSATRRAASPSDVRRPAGSGSRTSSPPGRNARRTSTGCWRRCSTCFVSNEYIPLDLLSGSLADAPVPVYLTVALPPVEDRSIADVWTAMGGELKPSLDLVVTAPLVIRRSHEAGPPVMEEPVLRVVRAGQESSSAGPRGATSPAPSSGRCVPGRSTGRGACRARAGQAAWQVPGSASPASPAPADDAEAAKPPAGVADETRSAGTEEKPGRTIRVRDLRAR